MPQKQGVGEVPGKRPGRLGFLGREKSRPCVLWRWGGEHFTFASQEGPRICFLNGYKNKKAQQGPMKSKPGKTHFSSGQLKPQGSPPLVAAPSDSPRISPQNELSKSADLVVSLFCHKALTFSCCLEDKGLSPQPGMRFPRQQPLPRSGASAFGVASTPSSGPPSTQAPRSPRLGLCPPPLCWMAQGSFVRNVPGA